VSPEGWNRREAFTRGVARSIIVKGRGTQFDPLVVDAFLRTEAVLKGVAELYKERAVEEKPAAANV